MAFRQEDMPHKSRAQHVLKHLVLLLDDKTEISLSYDTCTGTSAIRIKSPQGVCNMFSVILTSIHNSVAPVIHCDSNVELNLSVRPGEYV